MQNSVSMLARNLLQPSSWKSRSWQPMMVATRVQTRNYRFGRQVNEKGYYLSPEWFDDHLPASKTADKIVRAAGLNRKVNVLFDQEKKRQQSLVTRVEKIEVLLEKPFPKGEDTMLMMNANLSTPYDCAAHISQLLTERSALAVVDSNLWDMHRPLTDSCRLRLLHYKHEDTQPANYAFWRTCSMVLGGIIKKSFKDEYNIQLVSLPVSDLSCGSFFCDVEISNLLDWQPKTEEMSAITSLLWREIATGHQVEPLTVTAELASQLFADNRYRLAHIESKPNDDFHVYRIGDHIELSHEPLIASVSQINNFHLCSVHRLKVHDGKGLYRFQGVALPKQVYINSYAFSIIKDRAKQLNTLNLE